MDPLLTLEPSAFSRSNHYYTPAGQNNSASQLQAGFYFFHSRRNGTEASVIAPGSLHDPRYHGKPSCTEVLVRPSLNGHESGSDYSSIPRSVQSMPNYQLRHLCDPPNPHTHLPLEGMFSFISFCIKGVRTREIGNLLNMPAIVHFFIQTSRLPMVKSRTCLSKAILLMAPTPSILHLHGGVIMMMSPGERQIRRYC
jgi:hypothetical protein